MGQCISFTSTSDDENDNNEDLEQPMIYAKNSFDRFGDDLFGLIVSYLTLDERLDYECVSKQFQRTAFDSVFEITIHDKKATKSRISVYNREMLATIDRKCPNIHTIDCRGIRSTCLMEFVEMLTIFVSNLNRNLRYIYCNYDLNVYHLLPSLGRLITRIGDISLNQNQMLIHCRVSCLRVQRLSDVFDNTSGQLLAKNLRRIELFRNPTDDMQQLSAFVAENQSLKSFKVFYNNYFYSNVSHETIIEMAEQLSRLPQLRELGLNVQLMIGQNSLNEFLRTIGQKCPQLQSLTLKLTPNHSPITDHTIVSLIYYHRLKRLDLTLFAQTNDKFMNPLKLCHRLTHLSLKLHQMSDKLFINCDKHWPRLQCLFIDSYKIKLNVLDHISRLPALQTLGFKYFWFYGFGCFCTIDCYKDLWRRSPKLKTIEIDVFNEKRFYCRKNT